MKIYGEVDHEKRVIQKILLSLNKNYNNIVVIIEETKSMETKYT